MAQTVALFGVAPENELKSNYLKSDRPNHPCKRAFITCCYNGYAFRWRLRLVLFESLCCRKGGRSNYKAEGSLLLFNQRASPYPASNAVTLLEEAYAGIIVLCGTNRGTWNMGIRDLSLDTATERGGDATSIGGVAFSTGVVVAGIR
eukprot:scaffold2974_cov181-Amphora_coffeaeformis.AAC.30